MADQSRRIPNVLGIVVCTWCCLLIRTVSPTMIPGFQECVLNHHRYSVGESFHPVVEVNGTYLETICFECICQPSTIAQCEQTICPPADCPNPIRLAGECCPLCLLPPIPIDPLDEPCFYEGIPINSGDVFRPANIMEDFEAQQEDMRDECVECKCEHGNITCRDMSANCPALSCNETEAEYIEGECCMKCPVVPPSPVSGEGCYNFNGKFILEGESWNPVLPGYGRVECVNCTCQDSLPSCERLPCPEVPPCGPNDTTPDVVVCCPKCSISTPTAPPEPSTTPNTSNATEPTSATTVLYIPVITPCESPYVYKIFRNIYYDALALHNIDTSIVDIFNWTTMVGAEGPELVREHTTLSEVEFVDLSDGDFFFVGWTIDRRVRGLMNKESKRKRIEACTENCARMVANMLRPVSSLSETLVCG